MESGCLLPWIPLLATLVTCMNITNNTHGPTHREHLWSPPRVDPLLCESLQDCKDSNSNVQYVKELCKNPNALPPNVTRPTSSPIRDKRAPVRMPRSKMKPEEQQKMVEMHNYYRRKTKPEAGDMLFMKWDDYLAQVAQMWADNCVFDHGFPEELDIVDQGQNLYIGYDPTGHRATELWWEEYPYYDFETLECEDGEQCGHYTQMAWADSEYVGCGVARCPKLGYYVVCHYRPQGNVPDFKPFTIGSRCSQCWSIKDGAYCSDGLCVTKQECESMNLTCGCNITCKNCATLSPRYCRCICKKGWDSTDCSRPCSNLLDWCGESPGYPDRTYCHQLNNFVRDRLCRQMCLQCKPVDKTLTEDERSKAKDYCCAGKECEEGYVLDPATCSCGVLCPGPACLPPAKSAESELSSSSSSSSEEEEEEEESLEVTATVLHPPDEREASPEPAKEPKVTGAPAVPVMSSSSCVCKGALLLVMSFYYTLKYVHHITLSL